MAEIIIAIFIFILVGIVGINTVQAGKDYSSSKSNTFSVHLINEDIGNLLIREGIGGAEINRVTDALARGISDVDLKALLIGIGLNEEGIQKVFTRLDELGTGDTPQAATDGPKGIIDIRDGTGGKAISAPTGGDVSPQASQGTIKEILPSAVSGKDYNTTRSNKEVSGVESETEKKASVRKLTDKIEKLRQDTRENAKEFRDNFRENVRATIGHVDHDKTARIALAHGKGLRMLNRFRSAAARFDHILGRLESRVKKLEAQGVPTDSFFDVFIEIEEAKNMSVENKAKMEELKATYESLLLGENPGGVAEEARAIAKELKMDIELLRSKLIDIKDDIKEAAKNHNASKSNTAK